MTLWAFTLVLDQMMMTGLIILFDAVLQFLSSFLVSGGHVSAVLENPNAEWLPAILCG